MTDGALFPLAALGIVLPLFLPIAVAVTAGEAIAGEGQAGTLRYVLVRPVGPHPAAGRQAGRGDGVRLVTVLVVAATAYVIGTSAARPGGPDHRHDQRLRLDHVDPGAGGRTLLALVYAMLACSGSRRSRCSCRR